MLNTFLSRFGLCIYASAIDGINHEWKISFEMAFGMFKRIFDDEKKRDVNVRWLGIVIMLCHK